MPIDFVEQEKGPAAVEFFATDTKAKPQHLEGEVIPELIHRVGDVKSKRISMAMVEAYMKKQKLIFDPKLLKEMFEEADYRVEGSLDPRALAAAIGGRYPKRKLTVEWRSLTTLLLGVPELILTQDKVDVKEAKNGVFGNGGSVWGDEPPALPGKKLPARRRADEADSDDADAEPPRPMPTPAEAAWVDHMLGVAPSPPPPPPAPPAQQQQEQPDSQPQALTVEAVESLEAAAAGADGTRESVESVESVGAAAQGESGAEEGVECVAPPEMPTVPSPLVRLGTHTSTLSQSGGNGSLSGCGQPEAVAPDEAAPFDPWSCSPSAGLKAWSATLPPSGITLSSSQLATLRCSITSTLKPKPQFVRMMKGTGTGAADAKVCIGAPMDLSRSLARTEPTRPTAVAQHASFLEWGDYATGCRTAPSKWFNEHPAVPAAVKAPSKFPWRGADE